MPPITPPRQGHTWRQLIEQYPTVLARHEENVRKERETGLRNTPGRSQGPGFVKMDRAARRATNAAARACHELGVTATQMKRVLAIHRAIHNRNAPEALRAIAAQEFALIDDGAAVSSAYDRFAEAARAIGAGEPTGHVVAEQAAVHRKSGGRRRPLYRTAQRAVADLRVAVNTLDRVTTDDRFAGTTFPPSVSAELRMLQGRLDRVTAQFASTTTTES